MGLVDFIRRIVWGDPAPRPAARHSTTPASVEPSGALDLAELSRRVGVSIDTLQNLAVRYHEYDVPKRSGGARRIAAPSPELKALQRLILRRVLGALAAHAAAHGFERDRSIVTTALPHAGRAVVLKLDVHEFFASTPAGRVRDYFRGIGWDAAAADVLTRLCTHRKSLPQGAPTSPRLSNLVNARLDARLAGIERRFPGVAYTRYADDITFSFPADDRLAIHAVIRIAKKVLAEHGYRLHERAKLQIRRRHDRQLVTGLVVNDRVRLPRDVRRRLRSMAYRASIGKPLTVTPRQFAGWQALVHMVESQAAGEQRR